MRRPGKLGGVLRYETCALPFLRYAILRHLEELPAPISGLTRTERFILEMIYTGACTPVALFHFFEEEEEAPFMGDWSFWRILDALAHGAAPFLTGMRLPYFSPDFSELSDGLSQRELKLTAWRHATTARGRHRLRRSPPGWRHDSPIRLLRWNAAPGSDGAGSPPEGPPRH